MAVTCGYFNSIDGDRKYNAETMTRYFEGLISDGVYNSVGDKLVVTKGDDLSVNVATGRAMISCRWINNSSVLNLPLETADSVMSRYDAIVLHLDLNDNVRDFTVEVKQGTNALSNPTKPTLINTTMIKELCLAYVLVDANANSIKSSNIEDMRGSSECPWVTGLIEQVDTSTLFNQFTSAYQNLYDSWVSEFDGMLNQKQTEFEEWFANLETTLSVNVTLKSYQNIVKITSTVGELPLGIAQYLENDILLVDVNGLSLSYGMDYSISGDGATAIVTFSNQLEADNTITFTVIKANSL